MPRADADDPWEYIFPSRWKTVTGRMLETKAVVHIADLAAESAYIEERHPAFVAGVELGGGADHSRGSHAEGG